MCDDNQPNTAKPNGPQDPRKISDEVIAAACRDIINLVTRALHATSAHERPTAEQLQAIVRGVAEKQRYRDAWDDGHAVGYREGRNDPNN